MSSAYDELGPRIEVGPVQEDPGFTPLPRPSNVSAPPPRRKSEAGNGSSALAVISLVVALAAIAFSVWLFITQPEVVQGPMASPGVVPGGTGERVVKLEKDVSGLILKVVTLEKDLQPLRGKAGTIAKLTSLNAKIQELQTKIDALAGKAKQTAAGQKPPVVAAPAPDSSATGVIKPEVQPEPDSEPLQQASASQSQAKNPNKKIYTVKRGDSLFDIALRYKVTVRDLKRWNNLKGNNIQSGQKLTIYK